MIFFFEVGNLISYKGTYRETASLNIYFKKVHVYIYQDLIQLIIN